MKNITVIEKDNFIQLETINELIITNYKTDEPITSYKGGRVIFLPKNRDYSSYYTISKEEHDKYVKERNEINKKNIEEFNKQKPLPIFRGKFPLNNN